MADAVALLNRLRKQKQKIEVDKSAADARVASAREQRDSLLVKLKGLGVDDPKQIDDKLQKFEDDALVLLDEISNGIPERYRNA